MFDALRDSSGRQFITFLIVFRIASAANEQLCASNYQYSPIFFCNKTLTKISIMVLQKIMTEFDDIFLQMKRNPKNVRFVDLCKVCDYYFAKAYQVKQVINAIERLEVDHGITK